MSITKPPQDLLPVNFDASTGKHVFQLKGFEPSWAYAQAIRVGQQVFISGTVSIDTDGSPKAVDDMAGQVRNIYADIATSLSAHGATLGHIVREAIVTTDLRRFIAEGTRARADAYAGHALPTSAPWIEVPRLAHEHFLVEVEVMAVLQQP